MILGIPGGELIFQIYFYFVTIILINACKGQVSESSAIFSKPKPTIRGISPSIIPQAGLKYDTNLVSQYIRSIFQDSREITGSVRQGIL